MIATIVISVVLVAAIAAAAACAAWEARLDAARKQDRIDLMLSLGIADAEDQVDRSGWLAGKLDAAGITIPTTRFILYVGSLVLGVGVLCSAFMGVGLAVLAGVAVLACSYALLLRRASKRMGDFEEQLGFFLPMVAENTRAGQTFEKAVEIVSAYMDDPLKSQFDIVLRERSFGVPIPEAIENLAKRTKSADVEMMAAALAVQAQTGGSLSTILASIGETVQRRGKIRRTIRATTAEGRLSNYVVFAIPFGLALMISVISPGYFEPLFTNPLGIASMVFGLGLAATGLLLSRRLLRMPIY